MFHRTLEIAVERRERSLVRSERVGTKAEVDKRTGEREHKKQRSWKEVGYNHKKSPPSPSIYSLERNQGASSSSATRQVRSYRLFGGVRGCVWDMETSRYVL